MGSNPTLSAQGLWLLQKPSISIVEIPHSSNRPHVIKKYKNQDHWIPLQYKENLKYMGGNSKISTTAHEEGKLKAAPPAVICIGSSTECLRIENLKIDKIVMFGAGASAGCGKVYPYDPPTGTKLYSKLLDEFPKTWGRIPDDLKATFKKELRMDLMIFGTTTQRYMRI